MPLACRRCGEPLAHHRHWYCNRCRPLRKGHSARELEARRGQPSAHHRGYDAEHRRLRKRWAPLVATGAVVCARCDALIAPGEPWDLGHDDEDRSRYTGPEHRGCNRATAGRQPPRRQSRRW